MENGMSESEWQERAAAVYLKRVGRPINAPEHETYTVIGLWYDRRPVVAGVFKGRQEPVDEEPNEAPFGGRWSEVVSAGDPVDAETVALQKQVNERARQRAAR